MDDTHRQIVPHQNPQTNTNEQVGPSSQTAPVNSPQSEKSLALKCGYCFESALPQESWRCQHCQTIMHHNCKYELGGCTSLGCRGRSVWPKKIRVDSDFELSMLTREGMRALFVSILGVLLMFTIVEYFLHAKSKEVLEYLLQIVVVVFALIAVIYSTRSTSH